MISDKELAIKLKPSLKRFDFNHEQLLAIAVSIKQNQNKLNECISFLYNVDILKSPEEIKDGIIEICYKEY